MGWFIRIAALAVMFVACLAPAGAQQQARRIALVIGNAAYVVPAWRLANPVRDANLMTTRLRALGFEVETVRNGTRQQMEMAFERFSTRLRGAGPSAVSVFYYSGHGAEEGAVNYLVPVDADIRTKEQLRFRAPSAQLVLDDMGQAGNAVNIMILDACRDLPLADGARGLSRGGLAELRQTPNVLVAYATAPNQTAADGGGANSPFTAALAEALRTQAGDPVSLLFEDVGARVRNATSGVQRPRYSNGLPVPRWSFGVATPQWRFDETDVAKPDNSAHGSPAVPGSVVWRSTNYNVVTSSDRSTWPPWTIWLPWTIGAFIALAIIPWLVGLLSRRRSPAPPRRISEDWRVD